MSAPIVTIAHDAIREFVSMVASEYGGLTDELLRDSEIHATHLPIELRRSLL